MHTCNVPKSETSENCSARLGGGVRPLLAAGRSSDTGDLLQTLNLYWFARVAWQVTKCVNIQKSSVRGAGLILSLLESAWNPQVDNSVLLSYHYRIFRRHEA